MTLPKRWLDDDGASPTVRDVLRAGRGMDPPAGAEDAVWLSLGTKIAAGAAVTAAAAATTKTAAAATTATGAGTSATAVASGGLLKSILIGAVGGVIAVTGYTALEPSIAPAPAPQAPIVAAASDGPRAAPPLGARGVPEPRTEPTAAPLPARAEPSSSAVSPSSTASEPPTAAASTDPAPASTDASGASVPAPGSPEERASRLREESDMLNQARAALRGGDTAGTMRLLEQARQKFPGGVLGQEREALAIEALAKSGARAEASSRAAAFIQAHPNSPHAARLQVFVQP